MAAALDQWPDPADFPDGLHRHFFTTIHAGGKRTTATGILRYYGEHDFRITVITELGAVLFDARSSTDDATVYRSLPGLDTSIVQTLFSDLSQSFIEPSSLEGLELRKTQWVLHQTDTRRFKHTFEFNPDDGRLQTQNVSMGLFDTLQIAYKHYNVHGWPDELQISRPARLYAISISFDD